MSILPRKNLGRRKVMNLTSTFKTLGLQNASRRNWSWTSMDASHKWGAKFVLTLRGVRSTCSLNWLFDEACSQEEGNDGHGTGEMWIILLPGEQSACEEWVCIFCKGRPDYCNKGSGSDEGALVEGDGDEVFIPCPPAKVAHGRFHCPTRVADQSDGAWDSKKTLEPILWLAICECHGYYLLWALEARPGERNLHLC